MQTAAALTWRRPSRETLLGSGSMLLIAFVTVAVVVLLVPSPRDRKITAFCDGVVATFLTTHDAVELDRAKFLIRWIRCDVEGRLP
jgi:hypothetical protein